MTRRPPLPLWLAFVWLLLVCAEFARAEPVVPLRAGEVAPYAGILMPGEVVRALLHAQDERDEARALLEVERERARVDLQACVAVADARERARVACEGSRVPPPPERAWAGWPWVAAGAGLVVGVGLTVLVVEVAR
ncbi:MAG: hypothetical protein IT379_39900 [Deltaproteobacteria bacterium]|nr:hypothetical protein [Deltaproteobacteria bacterium]